jgi:DNA-binding MarR family transcriptional regulator
MHDQDSEELSPEAKQASAWLLAGVWLLSRIRKRMTLSLASTFINVAEQEGLTVSELAARCGVSGEVMSKHLRDLGTVNRRHGPGLGLVTVIQEVHGDRRQRRVILTHQGASFARQIIDAMERARTSWPDTEWLTRRSPAKTDGYDT